jgi:hypothetical protein
VPLPGVPFPPRHCSACGYDLSGLDRATTSICPECGSRIDWAVIDHQRPRDSVEAGPVAIILVPHVSAIMLFVGFAAGGGLFPRHELLDGLLVLLILAYAIASPFCAICGVHALMGRPDNSWSRLFIAVLALLVCAALVFGVISVGVLLRPNF